MITDELKRLSAEEEAACIVAASNITALWVETERNANTSTLKNKSGEAMLAALSDHYAQALSKIRGVTMKTL